MFFFIAPDFFRKCKTGALEKNGLMSHVSYSTGFYQLTKFIKALLDGKKKIHNI